MSYGRQIKKQKEVCRVSHSLALSYVTLHISVIIVFHLWTVLNQCKTKRFDLKDGPDDNE